MAQKKRGPGRPPGSKNKPKTEDQKARASAAKQGYKEAAKTKFAGEQVMVHDEIAAIVLLALAAFLIVAVQTHLAGALGLYIGNFLKGLFGLGAYFLPYLMIAYGILMLLKKAIPFKGRTIILLTVLFLAIDLLNAARFVGTEQYGLLGFREVFAQGIALANGGIFGTFIGGLLARGLGKVGLIIVGLLLMTVCCLLLVNTPLSEVMAKHRERKEVRQAKRAENQERVNAARDAKKQETLAALQARQASEREIAAAMESRERKGKMSKETLPPTSKRLEQEEKQPKSNYAAMPGITKNQEKILETMERDTLFGETEPKPGYGLSGDVPEQIGKGLEASNYLGIEKPTKYGLEPESGERGRFGLQDERTPKDGATQNSSAAIWPEEAAQNAVMGEDKLSQPAGNKMGFVENSRLAPDDKEYADIIASGGLKSDEGADEEAVRGSMAAAMASVKKDNAAGSGEGTFTINGESVATQTSDSESSDNAVSVSPKKNKLYRLPGPNLLKPIDSSRKVTTADKQELNAKAKLLEETLASFGVAAKVQNVIPGPSVTRFELEPAKGVKVNRITNLSDDLALAMQARSIRMEAPIPGKAAVGIEIENEDRQMIGMKEMIISDEFKNHKSKLAFTVGRDIGGRAVVADIAKMPHMLIAGATGSGKSVCINSIIISLLYRASPEEVKLIMVDPKMVELARYNGIPHLMAPVVTDPKKAAAALQWAVAEMTERYKKFATAGVRDLSSFNEKMARQGNKEETMPQVVIVIDEMADLMMIAKAQVEEAICRLAQLARAAGMHLILATQRPSVDVVTGLIKANIPSRIALNVSSQIDSRTMIDMAGAEKLVGNGDMLFKPQDLNKPKRIQGPYVSDEEMDKVIAFVKSQGADEYDEEVLAHIEKGLSGGAAGLADEEEDELFAAAAELVIERGKASVSLVQRQFRIGYNRAARIIDNLEAKGVIGPPEGAKPRQVLMTQEEFDQM